MTSFPRRYQYLESLDSVRRRWTGSQVGSVDLDPVLRLQIFAEALLALALGRDIVVPQSFAFDSWGFMELAKTVLAARGSNGDTPFRLHLYGRDAYGRAIESYEDAVRVMLGRISRRDSPFVSSLFGELHGSEHADSIPRDAHQLLRCRWLTGERRAAFESVMHEFQDAPSVEARPRPNRPRLSEVVAYATAMPDDPAVDEPARAVRADLAKSLRKLDTGQPEIFDDRSRLRLAEPWPHDSRGRTPLQLVGGQERLDLMIEFVDSLYHRVVLDSIGVASGTFTTQIAASGDLLTPAGLVQDYALIAYAAAAGVPVTGPPPSDGPAFDMHAERPLSNPDVAVWVGDLIRSVASGNALHGLAELLSERAQRGDDGRARSGFWTGIDSIDSAWAEGNRVAAQNALEKHLDYVARILGRHVSVGSLYGTKVQLTLAFAGTAEETVVSWMSHWEPAIMAANLVGNMAGIAAPVLRKKILQFKHREDWAAAMGRMVSLSENVL